MSARKPGPKTAPFVVPALDRREVARFLREQPPREVPRRSWTSPTPGLVALPLLGARVIRRFD